MTSRENEEERNKRIGWITTVSVQLILLVICYLIIAWREPYPPIPEYGIELGIDASSGAPSVGEEDLNEVASANDLAPAEEVAETEPAEEQPSKNTSEVLDSQAAEKAGTPQEPERTEVSEEVQVKTEIKPSTLKTEEKKPETEPIDDKPAEQVLPEKTEVKAEVKKVDSRAVMGATGKAESQKQETGGQSVDQRAIYGQGGTDAGKTEGANLSLSGWLWDFKPKPDDQSNETGKIVFSIEVDREGNLRTIVLQTSTVSPSVAQKYREAVQKLTFSKTAEYKAAEVSKGTITFIITSK